ncbi:MAG: hypothetical protein V8Q30_05585 [Acutalibacteraceae bacterium]
MENVAGATVSTNNFKVMIGELMGSNMLSGDTAVREVAPLTEAELNGEPAVESEEGLPSESGSSSAS